MQVSRVSDRNTRRFAIASVAIAAALALAALADSSAQDAKRAKAKALASLPSEVPAPKDNPTTPAKVTLGKQLFFDPRLSGDNKMSCATCHQPDKALGDGLPVAVGHGDKKLSRNTPSLFDVGFYTRYLWDGRAKSLEEQALRPIESRDEMHQDLVELERELGAVPGYAQQFQAVFGSPVSRDGIAKALAAFQRTLVTKPSPYDRFLAGEKDALSAQAREGMRLFQGDAGCVRCHQGPLLSDGKFYRLGVGPRDKGHGEVTGKKADLGKFRTPSLRNVARTAPYMHDGSLKTLDDVVAFYYRGVPTSHPEGLPLDVEPLLGQSFSETAAIVAFLESLSGQPPEVSPPALP